MDEDLDRMSREQLVHEVKKLQARHSGASGTARVQELCWHHPALWGLLPEKTDPIPVVPDWPEFLQGCLIYRQSLDEQAPDAPRTKGPQSWPATIERRFPVAVDSSHHVASVRAAGVGSGAAACAVSSSEPSP